MCARRSPGTLRHTGSKPGFSKRTVKTVFQNPRKALPIWGVLLLTWLSCFGLPLTGQSTSAETVPQRARQYRQRGITKPEARPILSIWESPVSYDPILAQAELVILGTVRDCKSRLSGDLMHIESVYVFRVDQVIKGKVDWRGVPIMSRVLPGAEMKPLNDNEVLVIRAGGEFPLFGVQMKDIETAYPEFEIGRRYVFFLQSHPDLAKYPGHYGSPALKVYGTVAGPHSVIIVDKAGSGESKIRTLVNNIELRRELESRYQSRLLLLIRHLEEESHR
jgi:hypothetical protein